VACAAVPRSARFHVGRKRPGEREDGVRRRIGKEKLKLLYIFDCPDSDEKREKQMRNERSQLEARESVVVENPLRAIWDVELKIGQPGIFGATWTCFYSRTLCSP
jgi:hypothetical protein